MSGQLLIASNALAQDPPRHALERFDGKSRSATGSRTLSMN
jgi:hypothetical protein